MDAKTKQSIDDVPDTDTSKRLKELIESVDDWLWEIDRTGRYTFSSPQCENIIGYPPEEVIGKTPLDFMTSGDAERVKNRFKSLLEKPDTFRLIETEHLHKDGHQVFINTSASPFFDSNNNFLGYRGVDRDITPIVTLESQEKILLKALNQMAEASLMVDTNLCITYVNKAFCSLFGYQKEDIIGQPIHIMNPPETDSLSTQEVVDLLISNGHLRQEVKRRKADGGLLPVSLTASAIYDEREKLKGFVGTYFDLTAMNESAEALENAYVSVIQAISLTIEQRDPYTSGHQKTVARLAKAIAEKLHQSDDFIHGLELGAAIHDIGKISIPAEILNRPGRLSDNEMNLIKRHSKLGYEIIKDINFPWPVGEMILQHHERLDGSGYPKGLAGDKIILEARIIAVADVIEAISSHRPYRPAKGIEAGLDEICRNSGILYDADVVDACKALFQEDGFTLQ